MKRMNVKNHLSEKCGHTVISCKYTSIGCDVELKRKYMRAHEQDDKAHLNKALNTVVKLQQKSEKVLGKGEPMIFKVTKFQDKVDYDEEYHSPSFYTSPNGYHMEIEVDANGYGEGEGSHVSVFVYVIEGEYDAELNWPFVGIVTIKLLNQLEDKNHHSIEVTFTPEDNIHAGGTWGRPAYISHPQLSRDSVSNTQFLKDDNLYFRISVEVSDHKPWLECTV